MADINGIPYVESSDLVSAYPAVSQSLAQEVSDQLASKLDVASPSATGDVVATSEAAPTTFDAQRINAGSTTVADGEALGGVRALGYDGSGYVVAADLLVQTAGTVSTGVVPGDMQLRTRDTSGNFAARALVGSDACFYGNNGAITDRANFAATPSSTGTFRIRTGTGNNTGPIGMESYANSTATRCHIGFSNSNGIVGTITTSSSATAYNTSSDYRLKQDVEPIAGALQRLEQLNPIRFAWKADPSSKVDGFLAHEAQAVVPEAVTGEKDEVNEDGTPAYQGIDQSKLVPLLVAAVQELAAEVAALKAAQA